MSSPPSPPAQANCLNCATALVPAMRFCPECGQKSTVVRLTLHDLAHDFWHALTHTDRSALSLVRELMLRPGVVARKYVDGRRKSYFNPFTFLIVAVGVAAVALAASEFVSFGPRAGVPPTAVGNFLQRHVNLVMLFQVPLLALLGMLMFRGVRLHFAEHLVLAAYTTGFRSVFFTLVVAPLWMLTRWNYTILVGAYLALWTAYFAYATMQFHGGGAVAFFKGAAVALLTQVLATILIAAALTAAIAVSS